MLLYHIILILLQFSLHTEQTNMHDHLTETPPLDKLKMNLFKIEGDYAGGGRSLQKRMGGQLGGGAQLRCS